MSDLASVVMDAIGENDAQQYVEFWCNTGFPPLNKVISGKYMGGMPVTRMVEIYGPESSGKTAIATQVMISAQKAGGIAMFNDHERSFDAKLGEAIGLDTSPGRWIFRTPDTFEKSVTDTLKVAQIVREKEVIPPEAPIVVVFDSLASMVPQSKFAKAVDEQGMNDSLALAKATSSVFPTIAVFAEKYNMLILILNQEREKPGVIYGDPKTTPGGKAPKFYASVRIALGRKMLKAKDGKTIIGQEVVCKIVKNKVSKPYGVAKWRFMFRDDGTGYFDVIGSMVDYLCEIGALEKTGAWIKWTDGKKYNRGPLVAALEKAEATDQLIALLPADEEE